MSRRRTQRSERFFRSWVRVVLRFRWPLLLATLLGTSVAASHLPTLTIDNSSEVFMDSSSERAQVIRQLRDAFGHDAYIFALVEGDVFSLPYLTRLRALHQALAAIDIPIDTLGTRMSDRAANRKPGKRSEIERHTTRAPQIEGEDPFAGLSSVGFAEDAGWGEEAGGSVVERVSSLVNARWTVRKGESISVRGLLEPFPAEAELPQLKRAVAEDPALVGRLVNRAGTHSVVLIQTGFMAEWDRARIYKRVVAISQQHQAEGFRIQPAGLPAINASLNDMMERDLKRLVGAAIAATLLVLLFIFRHPLGVVGPLLVVIQSLVATLGAIAAFDTPFTVIMNILPSFLICVGVADAVHIQSVYRDRRLAGVENEEAIADAVATTGLAIVYTTATTCVGLLSFAMASLDTIADTGKFGALGVAVALVHSIVFLPILLSFNTKSTLGARANRGQDSVLDRFLSGCNHLSKPRANNRHKTRLTLFVVAVVAALAMRGASQLTVHQDFLAWFPEEHPTKQAFDALDHHMGGAADASLLIKTKAGSDVRNRQLLVALEGLEGHILSYRDPNTEARLVGNVVSILNPIRETNRLLTGHDGLPDSQRGVVDVFTLMESAAPQHVAELATIDMRVSVMTVRMRWLDAFGYEPFVDHLQAGVDRYIGDLAEVQTTGSAINTFQISSNLTMDLLRSFGLALLGITVMMVFVLGDLKLGLIAMLPNVLPIILVSGTMEALDIPIDIGTLLVASVALGLAVDDTIHFVHQFHADYGRHGEVERALSWAMKHSGRAMTFTSLILLAGNLILMLATVIMLQRFGFLSGLTVVLALLTDLVVAPALLRACYRDRPTPAGHASAALQARMTGTSGTAPTDQRGPLLAE